MDLTASILAAANAPIPADLKLEGINLFPILSGRAPVVERTLFWRGHPAQPHLAVRSGDWKLIVEGGRRAHLFNLREDIGERSNVIASQTTIARRLRDLLAEWERDVAAEARSR